jgi:basic amino acid/polyamine antiporter, APA family
MGTTTPTPSNGSSPGKNRLLRILGVTFGLAVAIGGTIGIGILRIPGSVAAQLGNGGLIMAVWIASGLYAFAGANTYAELGTMLPLAGGPYVFARRAYGEFGGFLIGWSDWLLRTSSMAYLAVALSEYSAALFSCSSSVITPVAIVVLIFFTGFHWLGLRVGSRAQEIMSLFKVIAFFVIIVSCFLFSPKQSSAPVPASPVLSDPKLLFVAIALSMQSILGTYSGWHAPVYFSEENTDPAKSIPRSLFSGVCLVMAIYVLFNLAMLYALPMSKLAGSKLVAADAAQEIFGGASSQIVTAMMLISLLGILNASYLFTPRVMFALSRDGLFFPSGARVNTVGTPTIALLITVLVAIALAAVGSFDKLFALTAFLSVLVDVAAFGTLFVLRRKDPDRPRPFRAWGYPFLPAIVLIGAVVLLIAFVVSSTQNSLFALIGIALSYPVYLLVKKLVKAPST